MDAETLAGVSNFLQDAESSGFLEAVVDVLDGAENLQDVVAGITQAVSNESSEFQQVLAGIMEAFPQILTWQQDEDVDVFKAADTFEENGVDIIFGYDHEHDIIDFGTIIELEGAAAAKENAVNDFIEYNETTGALTDGDDNNWFFVYSGFNPFAPAPAETVRIEVDGDVFVWDTGSNEFDMLV